LQRTIEDTALAIDAQLVSNLDLRALVRDGLTDLEASAQNSHATSFVALPVQQQTDLARRAQASVFFQTIVHLTKYDFYNRHVVWETIGYPDLLNDSGYLDKGFNKLGS
jgi:hypothetical protein